jgi:hypothetical protein
MPMPSPRHTAADGSNVQSTDAMQTQAQNATQCFSNQLCSRYGRECYRAISDCVLCLLDMSGNHGHPSVDFFTICVCAGLLPSANYLWLDQLFCSKSARNQQEMHAQGRHNRLLLPSVLQKSTMTRQQSASAPLFNIFVITPTAATAATAAATAATTTTTTPTTTTPTTTTTILKLIFSTTLHVTSVALIDVIQYLQLLLLQMRRE